MFLLVCSNTCLDLGVSLMNYIGTTLSALHFVPGQYVDVAANSYAILLF